MSEHTFSLTHILNNLNIESLNAMQEDALEAHRTHEEIILLSATGSGKTLAFLAPLLERIDRDSNTTQALIIVPSRELALQIEKVFKTMGTGVKVTCCYGGHLRETEENNLKDTPALIVGTPGRIADHIRRENIRTQTIHSLILDEFDKSLEQGFDEEMEFIIGSLPALRYRTLTSATEAVPVPDFVGLSNPHYLNYLTGNESEKESLSIEWIESPDTDKQETLFDLLCMAGSRSAIVFCNHRETVEDCSHYLKKKGIYNEFYHGAMEQRDRDSALCKFRNGTVNVLVTTDLAARGLDIPNIRYIIHYHLPHTEEIFTHRNGRTARMEASGTAILIVGPGEYLPEYTAEKAKPVQLPAQLELPERPKWSTLYIGAGKKNKINKIDIVGFLSQQGGLKPEDIGLIEVKDFHAFAAVRKSKLGAAMERFKHEKIKNRKVRMDIMK
ncbi:DEAD/DEAH box helicase [Rurimicrobium arvi]|uniref:DEAD/DEAH box helicase n=1 Tax=Rurimicrobium arvi TaxID=2049916 RepID=A0ABP8N1M6_9BACT